MAEEFANEVNANLDINTTQPRPLRGLKLRGVKTMETVECLHTNAAGDERVIRVRKEDYDKSIHGPLKDQISKRKSPASKKAPAKKKAAKAGKE